MKTSSSLTKILKLNHIVLLLFILFLFDQAYSQVQEENPVAAISLTKMKVLYLGIENPVKIAVSGYESDELEVSIEENGVIEGTDGVYVIKPDRPGKLTVVIKTENTILDRSEYQVKVIPDPIVAINSGSTAMPEYKNGGLISKEDLLKAKKLEFVIMNFPFDFHLGITEFSLVKETNGVEEVQTSVNLLNSNKDTQDRICNFAIKLMQNHKLCLKDYSL